MASWKRYVLGGVGIGAGFALTLAAAVGFLAWRQSRPATLPDWNRGAIKATFKDIVITSLTPKLKVTFSYSLENTTNSDYSIDGTSQVLIMATLPDGEGLEPDEAFTLPRSVYIPAKQKVVVPISKEIEYNDNYRPVDRADMEKLGAFLDRRLKMLDGIVLFDKTHRYEIVLPSGWPDLKKDANTAKK